MSEILVIFAILTLIFLPFLSYMLLKVAYSHYEMQKAYYDWFWNQCRVSPEVEKRLREEGKI